MRMKNLKAVEGGLPPQISIQTEPNSQESRPPDTRSGSVSHYRSPSQTSFNALFPPSPKGFNQPSLYPTGDFRNSPSPDYHDMKTEIMCNYLYQQQLKKMWSSGTEEEGVLLKKGRDEYACCPPDLEMQRGGLFDAIRGLNVRCAMTVNTRVVQLFLRRQGDRSFVPLENGLRLQILPSVSYIPECQKHHFAAFIQDMGILVVWDDQPTHIMNRVKNIEDQLMSMIWNDSMDEDGRLSPNPSKSRGASPGPGSRRHTPKASVDVEEIVNGQEEFNEKMTEKPRKIVLIQSILTAITLILVIAAIGNGARRLSQEVAVDHNYIRLALAAVVPLQIWLALFFMLSLATGFAQIIGPINQIYRNTKYYSGVAPARLCDSVLPHVTIQCPVYKEGLWSVIDPTIKSIKAAISTYEMQGGTANIFVNDDGMQLIPADEAQERREYYEEHNVGWVARPKHSPKPSNGEKAFVRAGKFKKASNMNYALSVSTRVEDRLSIIKRFDGWTKEDERDAYDRALSQVIHDDEGRTWAEGNVRIGDYILLIDSDTRVPTDCFLDAVSEMEMSPEVAIIQHASGVMNVTTSWFEKGITFFTNFVYTSIKFAVANGDVAPFVGHNAFLRWSAVQEVACLSKDGKTEKFWSEDTVSEDFDIALRLQTSGYVLRLAAYSNGGFKEGVSLTVYDELARWEKYAYGCGELVFHPFIYWFVRGPFTPLFRRFIWSSMPLHSKITIMAYVGTYYAIGSTWILTLANYCLVGWFLGYLDHFYIDSFKIYFSIVMVFAALGNLALAILRYRTEEKSLFGARKWQASSTTFDHQLTFFSSLGKLQMAPHADYLPWRNLPPHLASYSVSSLLRQYELGRHFQGGNRYLILRRSTHHPEEV